MISKVIIGRTFYGACRYVCMDQKRAEVLETEGVRSYDYKLMAADFEMQHALRPSLGKAVFHGILSFYPGEKIPNEKMVEIAKEYLQKLGIENTQYAITKHTDKNHSHLHIIANLVNNKGQTIKDNWIGLKGKKIAQELTYFGIGFKNNSGGSEIRNPYFKASSSPKDITTFNNGAKNVDVFEGFTDFLSFMVINKNQEKICSDLSS